MPHPTEPDIIVNGRRLSYSEAMSVRVAVSSMISDFSNNPDALGTDDHGRRMVRGYLSNLASVSDTMLSKEG